MSNKNKNGISITMFKATDVTLLAEKYTASKFYLEKSRLTVGS